MLFRLAAFARGGVLVGRYGWLFALVLEHLGDQGFDAVAGFGLGGLNRYKREAQN